MTKNPVIDEVAKAVATTTPLQEYCLFWWDWWPMCMTKAEWSGWMQALGAVAAIVALGWQNIRERKSRDREHAAKIKGILERAVSALKDLQHYCEKSGLMFAALGSGNFQPMAVVQLHETLSASSMQLERLPYWELPESGFAIELQNVLHAVSLLHIAINHAHGDAYGLLENLALACRKAETAFAKQLLTV